jgi:parvulin-like peptidyl-prolyl isomerase
VIASLVLAALSSAPGPGVVARVDDVEITRGAVVDALTELRAGNARVTPDEALETLVLDALLSAEARRTGLAEAPRVRELIEREKRRLALSVMIEREVASAPAIPEDELRRRYHSTADSVRLRILVFPSEEAARVALAIVQRSGSFDEATRAPVPGFEMPGGAGPKIRAQLSAAVAQVAFTTPIGAAAGPVQLDTGFALVKVVERRVGDEAGFAAAREGLVRTGRMQTAEAIKVHLREQFRKRARVTTDEAFLASLGRRPEATAAELDHAVATVNGKVVRYREIEPSIRQIAAGSGHEVGAEVRSRVLELEVDERLLQEAAAERGLLSDPAVTAKLPALERRVLAIALLDAMTANAPPSQREARRLQLLQAKATELKARARIVVDRDALAATARG